ncbi:hypothetical protein K502DRAFT_367957 [Neoconidiobolus thromboides FSU 785]|nr:hypothetical protein K502DRAFT_367957 [Neoconidiobolus thromboides FSU 785]
MILFNIDQLPDLLIQCIFNYIKPIELFQYLILNKRINKIIQYLIKINLIQSNYHLTNSYCYKLQQNYIELNFNLITHLIISTNDSYRLLLLCPNLKAISFLFTHKSNTAIINNYLTAKFNKLKHIKLRYPGRIIDDLLLQLKSLLCIIKTIDIDTYSLKLDKLIQVINYDKVTSIKIKCFKLNLDGLSILKQYTHLTQLKFIVDILTIPIEYNDTLNFKALKVLSIIARKTYSFQPYYLGDLSQLIHLELYLNQFNDYQAITPSISTFTSISTSTSTSTSTAIPSVPIINLNLKKLGFIQYDFLIINNYLASMISLNHIIIKFSDEFYAVLSVILTLPNLQSLEFLSLCFYKQSLATKTDTSILSLQSMSLTSNFNITKLTFNSSTFSIKLMFSLLALFPNLSLLQLINCTIQEVDLGPYNMETRNELTIQYDKKSMIFYNTLNQVQGLKWQLI